jgi:lipopolysaccharide transport system ATP-binding protein
MSDVAIRVEGLSKRYRVGKRRHGGTLREALAGGLNSLLRRHGWGTDESEFWALRDVSFEVARGEVVGVIGRNGAGKSTLLKLLSRITEPTAGRADVYGRIGSLLEVGTGFHPELTGRENVYLNGAILGMKRREIDSRFDQIVAFAEVERFIDTPVKHYSSGMYVRLAFAVAAHLEPEILIVDEVLAVGDAEFQGRCIEHFRRMRDDGKTVILISHNMGIIQKVCRRAVLLQDGRVLEAGAPAVVVERYKNLQYSVDRLLKDHARLQKEDSIRWGNGAAKISGVYTRAAGESKTVFGTEDVIDVVIEFQAVKVLSDAVVGIVVSHFSGTPLVATNSAELGVEVSRLEPGKRYRATFSIDNVFGDGEFFISCAVNNRDRTRPYARLENVHRFEVIGRSSRSLLWPRHQLLVEEAAS